MDLEGALKEAAEFMGISDEQLSKKRKKRTAKKKAEKKVAKRRVGRPAKKVQPASKPKKLPKTKLLSLRFHNDIAELTFRDLRKLKTPLKYLDKRLPKLSPRELRTAEISKNGKTIAWPDKGILVEVAYAMHCEG